MLLAGSFEAERAEAHNVLDLTSDSGNRYSTLNGKTGITELHLSVLYSYAVSRLVLVPSESDIHVLRVAAKNTLLSINDVRESSSINLDDEETVTS